MMNTPTATFLLLTASLLQAASPAVNTAKASMDPERLARIPVRMKAFVDKGTIAGAVTLVQRHGAVASFEAVGYQDLETKKPMRPDSIFWIASMTKPVTATGIMILVDEGKLALSDPVEKYIPEFRNQWVIEKSDEKDAHRDMTRAKRPLTLRDLLTHTNGMYGMPPETIDEALDRNKKPLDQVVLLSSQKPLHFQPGTQWAYGNLSIATLGRLIELASDQSYESFLAARIFQPLGMQDTFFFDAPESKQPRVATSYLLEKGKLKKIELNTKGSKSPAPEGGLKSTAADLAAFYQMVLNGGTYNGKRILSKAAVDVMTSLHTGDLQVGGSTATGYGLAWSVVRNPLGTLSMASIGTFGHGGAFGTYGWIDPAKDLVGVFLVQRPGAGDELRAFQALAAAAIQ
ncbi:MAG: beta-lactamase family protein [Acidobacteria bacterium]|nr:beta-lactamase family protein [Acidobacteriota bacterium]MBI3474009.1 beta-lactamase family protein [Candidatus Solibacter usitatus]